jgi:hypothetical protein
VKISPRRSRKEAPEIAWEASLGIYLIVKGFKPSPILSGNAGPALQTS